MVRLLTLVMTLLMLSILVPVVQGYCSGTKYQCGTAETTFIKDNKVFSYTVWFNNSTDKDRILKTLRFKISPYDTKSFSKGVRKKIISDNKWTVTKIALRTDDPQYSSTQFKENVDYRVIHENDECTIQSTALLPCQSIQIQIISSELQKLNKPFDITFGPFTVIADGSSDIELESYDSSDTVPSSEQWSNTLSSGYSSIPEKKPWYILLEDFLSSTIKKYF